MTTGDMAARIRAFDWSATPLGPIAGWPDRLVGAVETMLAAPQIATLAVGPDRVFVYNDQAARHYGDRHPAVLGLPLAQAFPHEIGLVAPFYDRAFAGEGLHVPEQPLDPGRTGTPEVFCASLVPVRSVEGGVVAVLMTGSAIGARLRDEEAARVAAIEAHHALLRGTVDSSDDMIQVFQAVRDDTGEIVDFRWILNNRTSEGRYGEITGESLIERNPGVVAAGIFDNFRRVVATGITHKAEHHYVGEQFDGWFFQSVVKLGDGVATTTKAIDDWKAAQAEILRLQQLASERRLSESDDRFRTLADTAPAMIWQTGADGGNLFVNGYFLDYTGKTPAQVAGFDWRPLIDPAHVDDYAAGYLAAVRGRRPWQSRTRIRRHDGAWRWFDNVARPLFDADGDYLGHVGVSTDIHAAVQAEAVLRASEERQAFLLELGDRMRVEQAAEDIIKVAARMLGERLGASRIVFAEIDDEAGTAHIRPGWTAARARDHPGDVRLEDFGGPMLDAVRAGRTVRFDDTGDPSPARAELAALAAIGVRAGISVPLIVAGRFAVSLNVHQHEPRRWTDDEIALVEEVAARVWGSVECARAEASLRQSEERLRQFGDALRDVVWIRDAATLQWVYLTPAFETVYGLPRDEGRTGDDYRDWQELILPEDRVHAAASIARVLAGEHVTFEYRIRRASDGAIRWLRDTDFPILDDAGRVALIGGIGHDFTEIRETEQRYRSLVEGIPELVCRAADGGAWIWASPQWTAYTGQDEAAYRGTGWLAALHPDDRAMALRSWATARDRDGVAAEYRIRHHVHGGYRWFQTRATPVRDRSGAITEWLGTSTDIDELRRLQELQRTLLAELQHRVRNILAVTQSIVSRSDDGERSTEEYVQHLQGRIAALARTQVLLTRRAGGDIDLESLIRDELLAQIADDDQFTLAGDDVGLSPKAAEVLTLAIHELATNATKYGAFARDSGRLAIAWRVELRDGERWLAIDWRESGVPIVEAVPRRRGFGAELVSRRIPYELRGAGWFELQPGGLHSRIEFPLVGATSILQTDGLVA